MRIGVLTLKSPRIPSEVICIERIFVASSSLWLMPVIKSRILLGYHLQLLVSLMFFDIWWFFIKLLWRDLPDSMSSLLCNNADKFFISGTFPLLKELCGENGFFIALKCLAWLIFSKFLGTKATNFSIHFCDTEK